MMREIFSYFSHIRKSGLVCSILRGEMRQVNNVIPEVLLKKQTGFFHSIKLHTIFAALLKNPVH
jgi:hypothetical protein